MNEATENSLWAWIAAGFVGSTWLGYLMMSLGSFGMPWLPLLLSPGVISLAITSGEIPLWLASLMVFSVRLVKIWVGAMGGGALSAVGSGGVSRALKVLRSLSLDSGLKTLLIVAPSLGSAAYATASGFNVRITGLWASTGALVSQIVWTIVLALTVPVDLDVASQTNQAGRAIASVVIVILGLTSLWRLARRSRVSRGDSHGA